MYISICQIRLYLYLLFSVLLFLHVAMLHFLYLNIPLCSFDFMLLLNHLSFNLRCFLISHDSFYFCFSHYFLIFVFSLRTMCIIFKPNSEKESLIYFDPNFRKKILPKMGSKYMSVYFAEMGLNMMRIVRSENTKIRK